LTYLVYNQYFKGEESVSLAESSGDSIKNLTLIDGSKITLNKNSTLKEKSFMYNIKSNSYNKRKRKSPLRLLKIKPC